MVLGYRQLYKTRMKRICDVVISVIGLCLVWPIMLLLMLLIRLDSKGSVIFTQERLGLNKKTFTIYKFRTLLEKPHSSSRLYEGDPRITKIGAILRKTSLDELPQLINIVKGDMSIIGPRPILEDEFETYKLNPIYNKRYQVKPGLFCTVDMKYRAKAKRELQFEMDANYVDDVSFLLDVSIFIKVIYKVLKREDVYQEKD